MKVYNLGQPVDKSTVHCTLVLHCEVQVIRQLFILADGYKMVIGYMLYVSSQ